MTLVDRSEDLTRLVEEGFDVEVRDGNLLVHHIPYVTPSGTVEHCILLSELTTNGEQTVKPDRHEVWVIGEIPHDHKGEKLSLVIEEGTLTEFGPDLAASCRMSGKPRGHPPTDYYEKITTYGRILGQYARAIDPTATHTDFPARETPASESVFMYHDAATSRSGLSALSRKLEPGKVAIVGLGGTGSYILDLVSKTPVEEVHLYDNDEFLAHNAFRAPGAASIDDLRPCPKKVEYLATVYGKMRRNIVPHAERVSEENVGALHEMSFVFLAMDAGPAKELIIDHLREWQLPFVDCGMGLHWVDNALRGIVRSTTGTPGRYDHIAQRVSFEAVHEDEYDLNLQTVDLNLLNAIMAVIRWKKYAGYYIDTTQEHNTVYSVAANLLVNGEEPEWE